MTDNLTDRQKAEMAEEMASEAIENIWKNRDEKTLRGVNLRNPIPYDQWNILVGVVYERMLAAEDGERRQQLIDLYRFLLNNES